MEGLGDGELDQGQDRRGGKTDQGRKLHRPSATFSMVLHRPFFCGAWFQGEWQKRENPGGMSADLPNRSSQASFLLAAPGVPRIGLPDNVQLFGQLLVARESATLPTSLVAGNVALAASWQ